MGIQDSSSSSDAGSGPTQGGDVSSPQDTRGEGTVSLGDRTSAGGQGSPDTNQAKTEPMPPTPGHADPDATGGPHTEPPSVPDLGDMNAGAANPQVARPTGAGLGESSGVAPAPGGSGAYGAAPSGGPGLSAAGGESGPEAQSTGEAHRAPGIPGTPGDGESVDTDVEAGAAAMTAGRTSARNPLAGDSQGVAVPSGQAAPGTSEQEPVVRGARTSDS